MGVIGYRVLGESPFFLSINVSMAGALYTMVSCIAIVTLAYRDTLTEG